MQNKIGINVFWYENKTTYSVYLSDQNDSRDLLLISNGFVSNYAYIKDFNRFMFNKTKYKGKKYFCKNCLQCFSSENVLLEHKEDCLVINGKQNVKLEEGFISFKNYSKQIHVPFKIYADFECILKTVDNDIINNDISYTRKYQDHILVVLLIKLCMLIINIAKRLFCTEEEMMFTNLLNQFLMSTIIAEK